jgi:hypothetical protein
MGQVPLISVQFLNAGVRTTLRCFPVLFYRDRPLKGRRTSGGSTPGLNRARRAGTEITIHGVTIRRPTEVFLNTLRRQT